MKNLETDSTKKKKSQKGVYQLLWSDGNHF